MNKKDTAQFIRQLTNYRGDVGLYKLSKGIKKGRNSFKNLIVAKGSGISGKNKVTMWLADDKGIIVSNLPVGPKGISNLEEAFEKLGYDLI